MSTRVIVQVKRQTSKSKRKDALYERIRLILDSARVSVSRSVNSTQVVANWLVGREILEEEQKGSKRAEYGKQLVERLSNRLQAEFGNGYSAMNLWFFRRFYLEYPRLVGAEIVDAPRKELAGAQISEALRRKSGVEGRFSVLKTILYAPRKESWKPGELHSNLSWTHYRTLLRVDKPEARAFYEIEAIQNNWAACTAGDNPTLGLILCADKNDAVVRYTLGDDQQKIFASKYKLYVPSEAELRAEIKREVKVLRSSTISKMEMVQNDCLKGGAES